MTPPIWKRLREAQAGLRGERVPLGMLAAAHGPAAQGTLLLLLAAPCLLPVPGVGTVLGFGIAAMAVAFWHGRGLDTLPPRVAELELPHRWAHRVLGLLARLYGLAGRLARCRLAHLAATGPSPLLAVAVALMSFIVILPIPFGNVLPAVALILIGLGLVFRDGLAVALGLATAGLAVVITTMAIVLAAVWGQAWLSSGFGGWPG